MFVRLGYYSPVATAPPPGDLYSLVVDATNEDQFAGSLVAHWPFESDLVDRIGARNGIIGGGAEAYVSSLPQDSNAAFNCAGVNWISVPHHATLKPAVGSLMAWFKPASIHNGIIASCNTTGLLNDDFALRCNDTASISCFFQFNNISTAIATSGGYYVPGQVICAHVTWNASGVSMYLDGNQIGDPDPAHTTGLQNNLLAWRFGFEQQTSTALFNGAIDEIAIWNRVLTRTEIELLAQVEPS